MLLAADHPLPPEEKAWLEERCRTCAKRFDEEYERLQGGANPREVRDEMDATVEKLTQALRERAKKLAPA